MTDASAQLRLAPADAQHSVFLWEWRNDPDTRRNSFSDAPIPWQEHTKWYAAALSDPGTRIYVLEDATDGPVAQARYRRCGDGVLEVHVTVAQAARGKGVGARVLRESAPLACRELGAGVVTAMVLPDNPQSLRAFEKAGYSRAGERETKGRLCHVLTLDASVAE